MNTISAREAANRTRRAMALRDLVLEAGWTVDRVLAEGEDGWAAMARTIELRTGRPFRAPSTRTQDEALGLIRGALDHANRPVCRVCSTMLDSSGTCPFARIGSCTGPNLPTTRPALALPASSSAPLPALGRNGLRRYPTNVSLMVD